MTDEQSKTDELNPEELEAENGEPLPDREAMSVLSVEPLRGPFPIEPQPGND